MKPISIAAALVGMALSVAGPAIAQGQMTDAMYKAERDRIQALYKSDKEACDKLAGNSEDVCQVQAKADKRIAEAELDAKKKGTPASRVDARVVRADAEYDVAKEKCEDLAGHTKAKCLSEAKVAAERAKAAARI